MSYRDNMFYRGVIVQWIKYLRHDNTVSLVELPFAAYPIAVKTSELNKVKFN